VCAASRRFIGKKPADIYLTQHYRDAAGAATTEGLAWQQAGGDWSDGFHTFAVEWLPDTVTYFVDGAQVHQQASLFAPTPMDIAFGVGTGDCTASSWVSCPSDAPAGTAEPLPSQMKVRSLKIYAHVPATETGDDNTSCPVGQGSGLNSTRPTVALVWDVDGSSVIETPEGVLRGDRGLPLTRYNTGNNGAAVNIYGGKGSMPFIKGSVSNNGGTPQNGSLEVHLARYRISLNALIPDPSYQGYCLLDYEHWRADWNSTPPDYRTASLELAGGNATLAAEQYEAGAKRFMLATINETRAVRPGCLVGWYGYPRNSLPHIPTASFDSWCASEPGRCFFEGYEPAAEPGATLQRQMNDKLAWLWDALDVITPSVYLGIRWERKDRPSLALHAASASTCAVANWRIALHPLTNTPVPSCAPCLQERGDNRGGERSLHQQHGAGGDPPGTPELRSALGRDSATGGRGGEPAAVQARRAICLADVQQLLAGTTPVLTVHCCRATAGSCSTSASAV
jgi:hypothetical protein